MKTSLYRPAALVIVLTLTATGCVDNAKKSAGDAGGNISVSSTASECAVSTNTAKSGHTTFDIKNDGTQITEFYLLGEDGLRIISEKENIAPGASSALTVTLQPGKYFTACKPGMRGANIGEAAFTVTGEEVKLSGEDQQLFDQAVGDYLNFVKNEVAVIVPKVKEFAEAYMSGDNEKARKLYAPTRVHYERIEPIAEALGTLDPRIDYREIDYLAEATQLKEDDPTFTEWLGFHRMEKDLWPPAEGALQPDGTPAREGWKESSTEDRKRIGAALITDIDKLYEEVHSADFIKENKVTISTVSNGASGLMEEISTNKVTGEENWWSHYDLWDFQANLEGSRIAFDLVAPIAERKGEEGKKVVTQIKGEFDKLQKLIAGYGNYEAGFTSYEKVTKEQQKELTAQIDATRRALSTLTQTVLGIQKES